MVFDCLHAACQGSQFNRVRDFEAKCYEKLEGAYLAFGGSGEEEEQQ